VSEYEPDEVELHAEHAGGVAGNPERPLWLRVLRGLGITLLVLVIVGVEGGLLLYDFGGMSGSAVPGVLAQYDQMVAAGQAPAIQQRFVIPIPGCQCHSKDPVLTAQHTRRHMNECDKCHNTRPAHMEPGVL